MGPPQKGESLNKSQQLREGLHSEPSEGTALPENPRATERDVFYLERGCSLGIASLCQTSLSPDPCSPCAGVSQPGRLPSLTLFHARIPVLGTVTSGPTQNKPDTIVFPTGRMLPLLILRHPWGH